jgi:carbamoyl-phosphate synthase large subunit
MPKRTDIHKIMLIGSGPIVIGQACEFDYSGTQACKALREEGFEIVLINSNPATIMTDPEIADHTYIEPVTVESLAKIIEIERPDALLPTLGGQTGLNVAVEAAESGVLEKYGVEMIGANLEAIQKAEDRMKFKDAMTKIGIDLPQSGLAYNMEEAMKVVREIGFPAIIRPSFTLGGTGGATAYNIEEFEDLAAKGIEASMINEILIEESIIGWKEYELEVMRDQYDNVVIICSIENLDAMGVHTGDSITVAPAQTLTDREYQLMRDASIDIIREIGVDTGGSNIQFGVNPDNGRMVVIEMNPRVSRSSALASKATGFPIAKIAAKLAVGYALDEIPNDITRETPASFEPTIDYCVVKIPRFTFEKFAGADPTLGISMKAVGETMSIGRTFKEALQKGLRSLEVSRFGLGTDGKDKFTDEELRNATDEIRGEIKDNLRHPNCERIFHIRYAFKAGMSIDKIFELTKIDRWFLHNMKEIVEMEAGLKAKEGKPGPETLYKAKQYGFSDRQLAEITGSDEKSIFDLRKKYNVIPSFKLVDTCAAEFEAFTPYYYSSYESEDENRCSDNEKVVILGGGPNRIGQGIEFDYCCVHASLSLKEEGVESIMVNSNPETVSTDYDISDKLYFEPLTLEDVLAIIEAEKPLGVIVQFGGQTPLNLAVPLEKAGVKILGTSPDSIDRAEDRERFSTMLRKLDLTQPDNGLATSFEEASEIARRISYPVLVRPSYVLGGRAMEIVYDEKSLENYIKFASEASPDHPILIDKFLEDAIEIDVDAICDGKRVVVGGIMEHIEQAGIHSGDSACSLPPITLDDEIIEQIKQNTYALALELNVKGLMNIQYAVRNDIIYVLEVNPRASRTIPFVSKAIGAPLAKLATKVMLGKTLDELGFTSEIEKPFTCVKESVFPFKRFPGVDAILGPEMKSTGEVMGIDKSFGMAFAKAQLAAGQILPLKGKVFISVRNQDKRAMIFIAKKLADLGFELCGTRGTHKMLTKNGLEVELVNKLYEGRPNVVDKIINSEIDLIINTPAGKLTKKDEARIRSQAIAYGVPLITTMAGAQAGVTAIETMMQRELNVKSLQMYHKESNTSPSKSPA